MKTKKRGATKHDCLAQCVRYYEACESILKTPKACAERVKACTKKCGSI